MPKTISKEREHYLEELRKMVKEEKGPKEKVFAVFCQRHGVPLDQCKGYYDELMAKGEIKEK